MNKLLTKIVGVALGATMAVGVGVAAVKASDGGMQRAEAAEQTLTFDLTSNPGGWPTANESKLTTYTYTLNGVDYSFALRNVKCNTGYLMCTSTAALGLPAISGSKLTKVVAHNSSGCSTSTRVGITSEDGASYITGGAYKTWSSVSSDYTYNLTETSAGVVYYLYVTNKNAQITSLALTYETASSDPSDAKLNSLICDSDPTNLSYYHDATSAEIDYTGAVLKAHYTSESQPSWDKDVTLSNASLVWTLDMSELELTASYTDTSTTPNVTKSYTWTVTDLGTRPLSGEMTSFSAVSGYVTGTSNRVRYLAEKGDGTTNPAINSSAIRLYKPASGKTTGGTLTISVISGYVIKAVSIKTNRANSFNYSVDGGGETALTSTTSGSLNLYSLTSLTANSVKFLTTYSSDYNAVSYLYVEYEEGGTPVETYTVTYVAGTHGTGSYEVENVPEGDYTLLSFAETGLSADTGYRFANYSVGGVDKDPGDTIEVDGDVTITAVFEVKPAGPTYDFVENFATYASAWTTTYGSHTVTSTDLDASIPGSFTISRCNKSTSTITDRPVLNGKTTACDMVYTLDSSLSATKTLQSVTINYIGWKSDSSDVSLYRGTDTSLTPVSTSTIAAGSITVADLNSSQFTFHMYSSKDCRIGLTSVSITLKDAAAFGTLDHIKLTSKPTKTIYHVGESFDITGLVVTAFDGADESEANSKVVTSEIDTDLENGYTFVSSDVPGITAQISYTEGSVTAESVFYTVKVYDYETYEPITSEPESWDGTYIITGQLSQDSAVALSGALEEIDVLGNYNEVVVDSSGALTTTDAEFVFIQTGENTIVIKAENGKYVAPATGNSNGIRYSDSAVELTITYSAGSVTIGNGTRNLLLNTNSNQERFRFMQNGSAITLYKGADSPLVSFAKDFFNDVSGVCDDQGSSDIDDLQLAWASVYDDYLDLSADDKLTLKIAEASETGGAVAKAMALYDYVAAKYNTRLESQDCPSYDFMQRGIAPASNKINPINKVNNTVAIVVVVTISLVSVSALGAYFLLRKKKEER